MFRKIIYICIFLLIYSPVGFSQIQTDSVYSDFGVSVGINSYQIKERVLNNIRHAGIFPTLCFSYEWSTDEIRQTVELAFVVNMLKSRYESEHSPITIDLALNYRQVRKFSKFYPDLNLFLGGITGFYSHMSFFDNWDNSHIYWLTYYYLGINSILTYGNPLESSAYLELTLPLISLVSRPPERFFYKIINDQFSWIVSEIHRDLRLTSIHQHFVLNLDIGYKFKHSASFTQKVYWRISYTNTEISYSKDVTIMINTLGTVLLF